MTAVSTLEEAVKNCIGSVKIYGTKSKNMSKTKNNNLKVSKNKINNILKILINLKVLKVLKQKKFKNSNEIVSPLKPVCDHCVNIGRGTEKLHRKSQNLWGKIEENNLKVSKFF